MRVGGNGVEAWDNPVFAYSALPEPAPIRWPGGARVAFYVGLNIEDASRPQNPPRT